MLNQRAIRPSLIVLALFGATIASYLTYVHYSGGVPICPATGKGCETVQTSEYATLLGTPVALFGILAFTAVLAFAVIQNEIGRLGGVLVSLLALCFSAYLTYHEVFTLKALCFWCLVSATLTLLITTLTILRLFDPE